jgi:hypothetical protein
MEFNRRRKDAGLQVTDCLSGKHITVTDINDLRLFFEIFEGKYLISFANADISMTERKILIKKI